MNDVAPPQTEVHSVNLNEVRDELQNLAISPKLSVSPGSTSATTITPRTPSEPVADTTPRTFSLYFRSYAWFLKYTVNLNEDGSINQNHPLVGMWVQLKRQIEAPPKMSELPDMIIDGSAESISFLWKFSGIPQEDGSSVGRIKVASRAKMLMVVTPHGVSMRIDGRDLEITHLWVDVQYLLGIPKPSSIATYLYLEDTCVCDGETSK
eukprot:GEMP01030141.1.p1 GENE.GEMP01030141.1~~GEMP01030141.1.p1  ORF type:complete len:208 (+),score=28.57 GEMP01030141.1:37-660(+)